MIVKNESKIITRLLDTVYPIIDTYCICDTGSDDNTIEIIKEFFDSKNINGKIVKEAFRDFGYNRNYAKLECLSMDADYLLLLDADMKLELNIENVAEFKEKLTGNAYYLFQGNNGFFYKNVRIIENSVDYTYRGVTHEYVETPPDCKIGFIEKEKMFIVDVGDGGSKENKFTRDIKLLKDGLRDEPDNVRYMFYLANSYLNMGQYHGAIETYKKRIQMGGWKEELWYSHYSIGKAYMELEDMNKAVIHWMEAYQILPNRIENLYEIVKYYRMRESYRLAYSFYEMAEYQRQNHFSDDHLFHDQSIYDYKMDYELSILGYYCNDKPYNILESIKRTLCYQDVPQNALQNVLVNYKFYSPTLINMNKGNINTNNLCDAANEFIKENTDFVTSTPSLTMNGTELYVNIRCVNYHIDDDGNYINKDTISSHNIITVYDTESEEWKKTRDFVMNYDKQYDGEYVGVEDIKLLSIGNMIHYNGNRGLKEGDITIETGTIDKNNGDAVSMLVMKDRPIEKNWVMFEDERNDLKVIHSWYPLKIGSYHKQASSCELSIEKEINTPRFFTEVRGSTNGINIDNEIWFIVHAVSYESRRHYYHMFVVLDPDTYKLKRHSKMFTFENKKVEYTTGMVYFKENNEIMVGYSIDDKETKFLWANKQDIEELFI